MIINWNPTTAEEVVQNVECIVASDVGTVPLARAFGTPQDVVDLPESVAGAVLRAAVFKAVRQYEPRAPLSAVNLAAGDDGALSVSVVLGGS